MIRRSLPFVVLALLVGCGTLPPSNPVTHDTRVVRNAHDSSKSITIVNGMVWYNLDRAKGIRFPPGTYNLEAEDADYWYFRSPAPLEFRDFSGGRVTDAQSKAGGIMIAKAGMNRAPAGGYVPGDGSTMVMVWKLGGDFLGMEGREWNKSF
jgi:hypothetical protein